MLRDAFDQNPKFLLKVNPNTVQSESDSNPNYSNLETEMIEN